MTYLVDQKELRMTENLLGGKTWGILTIITILLIPRRLKDP